MDRLSQIQLQNTVTVKVQCQLNEDIVVRNFKILMDCLRNLSQSHNDLAGKFSTLQAQLANAPRNAAQNSTDKHEISNNINKQHQQSDKNVQGGESKSATSGNAADATRLDQLERLVGELGERTSNNEKNILDNIRDINLVNKEIADLRDQIKKLERLADVSNLATGGSQGANSGNNGEKQGNDNASVLESLRNVNNEQQSNKQEINKTNEELERLRKLLEDMRNQISNLNNQIRDIRDSQQTKPNSAPSTSGNDTGDLTKAELGELREKIAILNKRTNGLELISNELRNETAALGQSQEATDKTCNLNKQEIEKLKALIQKLARQLNSISDGDGKQGKGGDGRSKNNRNEGNTHLLENLMEEISRLKLELKGMRDELDELRKDQPHSRTSIDEDKKIGRLDKASYTSANKFKDDDRIRDLLVRVQCLEKVLGSRTSIPDKDGDKLPMIRRAAKLKEAKEREQNHNQRSTSKRDIADVKSEIQAWVSAYIADLKGKDNYDDFQLKIQQLRNNVNKKADQQGMRKGLSFLENKINQLYLFLTQPDGEDAMIVRKGFNCLSCSKKVEKLRGKIGPHLNWNNMTATNYSPPKVGYSRHMGENSADKDEDL